MKAKIGKKATETQSDALSNHASSSEIKELVRRHKTRSMSIRMKVLVPAMLIVLIICLGMGLMFKNRIEGNMVATGGELAEYVGDLTINKLNGDLVSALVPGDEGSAAYLALKQAMESIRKGSPVKYMYTLYTDGDKVYYGLDADDADSNPIGTEFARSYQELEPGFQGNILRETRIDHSGDDYLITVYLPILNKNDEIIGLLGCDYDAAGIEHAINKTLSSVAVMGVIFFFLALAIFTFISNRITKNLWLVDDKIYDIVNSNGDLTKTIDIRTGDEVESIAGHVNDMLGYMRDIMANISDNSKRLNDSSESVVTSITDTQENVTEVSSTMEEMNATMGETAAAISRVNDSVNGVYEFIEQINRRAEDGSVLSDEIRESAQKTQKNALSEQEEARKLTKEISENVYEKIEQSKNVEKIGALTANIINITDQTNLLALNASCQGR